VREKEKNFGSKWNGASGQVIKFGSNGMERQVKLLNLGQKGMERKVKLLNLGQSRKVNLVLHRLGAQQKKC